MADNSTRTDAGSSVETIASDDIAGVKHQRVKVALGADGVYDGDLRSSNVGDNGAAGLHMANAPHLFNGTTWDRQRGNEDRTLLASAARTASTAAAAQTNYNARGVIVFVYVTAGTAGFSIQPQIYMLDGLSSQWQTQVIGGTITTAAPTPHTIICYPGATIGALTNHTVASVPLSRQWGVFVTHNNANSVTYSVGCSLIV